MVKNKAGGSRHKKLARKNVVSNQTRRKLRKVSEEGEIYARVLDVSGGSHARILCSDKKIRTLVIRGKFRGRNKRGNTIRANSMVLAGLRSVSFGEIVSKKKKEKADLIYVYNDDDMDDLKQISEIYEILHDVAKVEVNDGIHFIRNEEDELELNLSDKPDAKIGDTSFVNVKLDKVDEEFDWDDI